MTSSSTTTFVSSLIQLFVTMKYAQLYISPKPSNLHTLSSYQISKLLIKLTTKHLIKSATKN